MEHENCGGSARPCAKELVSLATTQSAINANKSVKGPELQRQWLSRDRIAVLKSTTYRVRDSVNNSRHSQYFHSDHELIYSWLEECKRLNPDSHTGFKRSMDDGAFERAFYTIGDTATIASQACVHLLQMDGAGMKYPGYNGVVYVLEGADGNNKNIILALALVPAENKENYIWFLQHVKQSGLRDWVQTPNMPLLSDRHKGIKPAVTAELLNAKQVDLYLLCYFW